ncbi:hypothetical protein NPIL_332701 [Nephila pilipes]|uniref:Uncharacterized protein n=1 Tax=Nephila pilipes TaxID=299642 RepID=A0A8X6NBY5_NEPPI|nr:hypothetical protein NPIL_332701 [Nephila pilipes]
MEKSSMVESDADDGNAPRKHSGVSARSIILQEDFIINSSPESVLQGILIHREENLYTNADRGNLVTDHIKLTGMSKYHGTGRHYA